MPKVKKQLRAPALDSQQNIRHEPLGQVIDGDANRGKYAVPSRRNDINKNKKQFQQEQEYLDRKTSQRILDMSREQDVEDELEEQRRWQKQHQRQRQQQPTAAAAMDSDDEEEEEEEEIFIDEIEEE